MQCTIPNEGPRNTPARRPGGAGVLQGALVGLLVGLIAVAMYMLRSEPTAHNPHLSFEADLNSSAQGLSEGKAAAMNRRIELRLDC